MSPPSEGVDPEGVDQIAAALAKAQLAFAEVHKSRVAKVTSRRTGQTFTYRYADLSDVIAAIRPALNANGIAIGGEIDVGSDSLAVTARLLHISGQELTATVRLRTGEASDPQAYGSIITYARRYALCAVAGVVAEDDDDANSAKASHGETSAPQPAPHPQPRAEAAQQPPAAPPGQLTPTQRFHVAAARLRAQYGPEGGPAKIAEIAAKHGPGGKVPPENVAAYVAELEAACPP